MLSRDVAYTTLEDIRHGRLAPADEAAAKNLINLASELDRYILLTMGRYSSDYEAYVDKRQKPRYNRGLLVSR